MPKYLDSNGVQHLWSKLSLQDYPNNETLVAIINAIDEEKADRTDLDDYLLRSDYVAGEGGGVNLTYEEWTFTLTDGTTVTKRVAIG